MGLPPLRDADGGALFVLVEVSDSESTAGRKSGPAEEVNRGGLPCPRPLSFLGGVGEHPLHSQKDPGNENADVQKRST
jgi:hypothetical protein